MGRDWGGWWWDLWILQDTNIIHPSYFSKTQTLWDKIPSDEVSLTPSAALQLSATSSKEDTKEHL